MHNVKGIGNRPDSASGVAHFKVRAVTLYYLCFRVDARLPFSGSIGSMSGQGGVQLGDAPLVRLVKRNPPAGR